MYKGQVRRGPFGFFRRPRGYIDHPRPGAELPRGPVHVLGWCLFPGTSVARVEVRVNGGPPERARLAIERNDIAALTKEAAAPVSGFEHKADLSRLPEGTRSVTIDATAYGLDGRELRLEPVEFAIDLAEPLHHDEDGSAAELRARSMRPLRPRVAPSPGEPLRLVAFAHVLTQGGASRYLLELLVRLTRDHGFHCEVVALADGPLRERFEAAGIPVHLTDGFPVTTLRRYEGAVAELVAWTAAGEFDAVLVNTLGSFAGGDAATRLGIPAVWTVHESFLMPMFWQTAYLPGSLHPHARAQAEQALASAAAVVFPAETTRRLFLDHAEPERLVAIPYGIELGAMDSAMAAGGERAAARRRLGIDPDAQVILCLGSVEARKSQTMLAAAFAHVAERHPRAELVLVGETSDEYCADYRAALHEFVRRAGLERRVRIEPVTDDPYSWHAVSDVLACASDIESLPRVIVEAMVFGTPVLSTRVFGVPELIEDERTGYLCDVRDTASLADRLERVLSAPAEELAAVTGAAAPHARARHDPDVYAATMATLLEGVAASPRALPADVLGVPEATDQQQEAARGL
ncbi:MAG: D-inositol-3-phosphate glycosyltransferase [Thermoleophilaceae bacterium]|nr:D-inositol-3-phosphate glycosyltransferase [Thermoleophilaceae bacterium]